jgi:prolyl-tRNA editing enzyme YbaK/EbsC (Cys-tRNA(Pro) deacylase)
MPTPLTPDDLQAFIETQNISAKMLIVDVPTPTVETAAQAVGTHPNQIVKSVLFLIEGEPVLAVAYGTAHIDRRGIAEHYGVGRKRVKLADSETVLQLTGYLIGGVPPFGHPRPISTLLDPGILEYDHVYAGGGSDNALICLTPHEILRVSRAKQLNILENGSETPNSKIP